MGHEGALSQTVMGVILAGLYFTAAVFLVFIIKINYLAFLFKPKNNHKSREEGIEKKKPPKDPGAVLDDNVTAIMIERENRRSASIDRIPAPPPPLRPLSSASLGQGSSAFPPPSAAYHRAVSATAHHRAIDATPDQHRLHNNDYPDGGGMVQAVVPASARPGDVVVFNVEGREADVEIPADARPGDHIMIPMPGKQTCAPRAPSPRYRPSRDYGENMNSEDWGHRYGGSAETGVAMM